MTEPLAQALASIIGYLGATPLLLFLATMGLGPWVILFLVSRQQDKRQDTDIQRQIKALERQDKRFEQVVRMYEDNVQLVKSYERHVDNQRETNDKLIDLVSISTATQQTLVDYIKNNWWCPVSKDPGLLNLLKERKQA